MSYDSYNNKLVAFISVSRKLTYKVHLGMVRSGYIRESGTSIRYKTEEEAQSDLQAAASEVDASLASMSIPREKTAVFLTPIPETTDWYRIETLVDTEAAMQEIERKIKTGAILHAHEIHRN